MKEIVTSTYSIEDMLNGRRVYVDKTAYIHKLVTAEESHYFISRPRRYGKSLMISTLKAIFEGKKELFKDCAIYKTDYDWKQYPVMHIDMGMAKAPTIEGINEALNRIAISAAKKLSIDIAESNEAALTFLELWKEIAEQNLKIVVLIDEYDVPLQGFRDDNRKFNEVRNLLHDFYLRLKEHSANIRFLMMTGVSKFTKLSIFSGLNNLTDLSMVNDYATMLGYTGDEITENFSEHAEVLAKAKNMTVEEVREKMREMYDGYHFSEDLTKAVYNPVSVGSCLRDKSFQNFWMATGQSSLIVELLNKSGKAPMDMEGIVVRPSMFNSYDLDNMPIWALLFQGGYLTIKDLDEHGCFILGAPNLEVKECLNLVYLDKKNYPDAVEFTNFQADAEKCLKSGDIDGAIEILRSTLMDYPFSWLVNDEEAVKVAFLSFFYAMYHTRIVPEKEMARGRIDAVWEDDKNVYIFEFKYGKSAQEAFDQIITKKYHVPYLKKGKRVIGIGLNWNPDKENRGLDDAMMKEIGSYEKNNCGELQV